MNGGVSRAAVVFCNTGLVKVDIHQTNVQADNKLKNLDWSCSPVSENDEWTRKLNHSFYNNAITTINPTLFVRIYLWILSTINLSNQKHHYTTMSAVGWVRGKWLLRREKKRSKQERKNAISKESERVATINQPIVRLASQDSSLNVAANETVVGSSYHRIRSVPSVWLRAFIDVYHHLLLSS